MLRLLHHACYGQALTCSNRHHACYAQAPTPLPKSHIKSDTLKLTHQAYHAGYAPAPTIPCPTHTTNVPKFRPGLGLGTKRHPSLLVGSDIKVPQHKKRSFGPRARSEFTLPSYITFTPHRLVNSSLARGHPTNFVYICGYM